MTAVATIHCDAKGRIWTEPSAAVLWNGLSRITGVSGGSVCVAGTGIVAAVLYGRVLAGESIPDVARDYDIGVSSVRACVALMVEARQRRQSPEAVFDRKVAARKGSRR